MIAITGANGNLGKATISCLLQKVAASSIVAIVRDPETVKDFEKQGVMVRQADYNEYSTLKKAFKEVEKVVQISTVGVDIETANRQEENVVNAMAENGVRHIVYTSMIRARPNTIFQGTATQYRTEGLIKNTQIPYTIFRNGMYMEAIPELIGAALQTGEICYPAGKGNVSFVSRTDIAEAMANVLTGSSHEHQTYEITGSKAYSFDELAQVISAEKNIAVRHVDITDTQFREELINYQLPSMHVVDLLVSMAKAIKAGEFSHTDDALKTLLGRAPLSLNEYIKRL